MLLTPELWGEISTYLFIDRKLSSKKATVNALKSRYSLLSKHFSHTHFTRANFTLFLKGLKDSGNKNTYINGFIKLAKHLDKYYNLDQIGDYTYFREEDTFYDVLSTNEIKRIAEVKIAYQRDAAYQEVRNRAFIFFVSMTGCRVYEAIDLEWRDVICTPIPAAVFRDTKNGETRVVPLRGDLYKILSAIPQRSARVFDVVDDAHLTKDLKRRVEACGIKKRVWWHLFRHSFITTMLEQGVDDLIIARIVGHKNPASTQRYNQMNVKGLALQMDAHPLFQESQTIDIIATYLKEQIAKLVSSNLFSRKVEEYNDRLVITIAKN